MAIYYGTGGGNSSTGRVVSMSHCDTTSPISINSTSYTNVSGMSAAITTQNSSNKVLVICNLSCGGNNNGNRMNFRLAMTGNDNIYVGGSNGNRLRSSASFAVSTPSDAAGTTIMFLHEPNSQGTRTYQLQCSLQVGGGSYCFFNRTGSDSNNSYEPRTASSMVLLELAS